MPYSLRRPATVLLVACSLFLGLAAGAEAGVTNSDLMDKQEKILEKVKANHEQLTDLDSKLDDVNATVSNLTGAVSDLTDDVAALTTLVSNVADDVTSVLDGLGGLTDQVTDLAGNLGGLSDLTCALLGICPGSR